MAVADPKQARRVILTVLYHNYQRDPLNMMTPSDMADASALLVDDLAPNCHYLHERDLIELIMGYTPPLFAAARIAPEGIDLYEDRTRFERFFSRGPGARSADTEALIKLLMVLAQEAEAAPVEGLRREWLLRDVTRLRELVRGPEKEWDADAIVNSVDWLKGFARDGVAMPSLDEIGEIMARRYRA